MITDAVALRRNPASPRIIRSGQLVIISDSTYAVTMIPVVIDTNVFVAGLRSAGGTSRQVLRLVFEGRLQPLFGNAL